MRCYQIGKVVSGKHLTILNGLTHGLMPQVVKLFSVHVSTLHSEVNKKLRQRK
jgi:hypothetical protein